MDPVRLSDDRGELYEPAARNQLIVAGAGSGKTYTLVDTVVERIRRGVIDPLADDQEVLLFTFTENAAEELVVRLSQELERDTVILNEMYVGTIHGWCNEYLDRHANLANTKILDELERSQLIQRIHGLLELEDVYETESFHRQVELFENDLDVYYNEHLELAAEAVPDAVEPAIRRYVEFVETQRLLDFGSLIRRAIETAEANADGTTYQLFVDEYQDVNPAQVELFRTLTGSTGRVFAVGDPRQAIYQWRGGDVTRILEFDEDFADVEAYTLATNRRSRPGIVAFSNAIHHDMDLGGVDLGEMTAHESRRDDRTAVVGDTTTDDHAAAVADELSRLHDDGVPYEEMAVLLRSVTSSYGGELMDALDDRGIPFHSPNRNAGTAFVSEVVFSIIDLIELLDDTHDREFQTRREQQEVHAEIQELCGAIEPYCGDGTTSTDVHAAVADWFEELARNGPEYDNEQYNFRQQFYDFCAAVDVTIGPPETALQEGFASVTQIMKSIEEVYRRRFRGRANVRSSPLTVFTRNLRWHLEHELERWGETGLGLQSRDAVSVSTVHAAKGLEWPVVFVPNLTTNRFPSRERPHPTTFDDGLADRYSTSTADEKRLWYVAATRARDRLHFYARDGDDVGPFAYESALESLPGVATAADAADRALSAVESPAPEPTFLHVGVSSFLLLLECPYHFHMRHSVGVNPPVGNQFGAGNVLHRTVERAANQGPNADLGAIAEEEVYLPLADRGDEARMRNAVRANVERLRDAGGFDGVTFSERPFTLQVENLVVSGVVDAIQETDGGTRVVDWKSSIHEAFEPRYRRQLQLYALALGRLGTDVGKGLIADLGADRPVEDGTAVDVSPAVTAELLSDARSRIASLKERGPYTTPSETACRVCDVSAICPESVGQED